MLCRLTRKNPGPQMDEAVIFDKDTLLHTGTLVGTATQPELDKTFGPGGRVLTVVGTENIVVVAHFFPGLFVSGIRTAFEVLTVGTYDLRFGELDYVLEIVHTPGV